MADNKKVSFYGSDSLNDNTSLALGTATGTMEEFLQESYEDIYEDYQGYNPNEEILTLMKDYFADIEDEDFINCVNSVTTERQHLILESQVFMDFLHANEPTSLSAFSNAMKTIRELEERNPLLPPLFEGPEQVVSAMSVIFSDLGPRINVLQRSDLVMRCIEEMEESLKVFLSQAHHTKFNLRAMIEESAIRMEETTDAIVLFENSMSNAIDPQTMRIPGEKFVWFMEEWLKGARQVTEKLRLRNNSLKIHYQKLKNTLEQKSDLGTKLHEVDVDQYRIENKYLKAKIEMSNVHLIELKHFHGAANIDLATMKRQMLRIQEGTRRMKQAIDAHDQDITKLRKECEKTTGNLQEVKANYDTVKALIGNCRAPDILDYLHVKAKLYELEKIQKVLTRKENLQRIVMNTTMKSMLNATGRKKIRKEWLLPYSGDNYDDIDFDLGSSYTLGAAMSKDSFKQSEFDIFNVIQMRQREKQFEAEPVKTAIKPITKKRHIKRPKKRVTTISK